jgi:hypothetical protein
MPIALVIIVMPVLLVCYGIEKTETAGTAAIGAEYSRRGGRSRLTCVKRENQVASLPSATERNSSASMMLISLLSTESTPSFWNRLRTRLTVSTVRPR